MSTSFTAGSRLFALAVFATIAGLSGFVAFMAAAGLVDSLPVATLAAITAASAASWWATRSAFAAQLVDVPRAFRFAFATGAVVVLAQLAVLGTFIIDPTSATWPAQLLRPWQSAHSCVSAYWVAARQARAVPDLYVDTVYRPKTPPGVLRQADLGPFFVDVFEYPPTFLPLPRLLSLAAPDFWSFRRLWFALNLAGVALGLVVIARRVDAALGGHALWLTPWALAAPSVIGTLQVGNVQLLVLVLSAVAMLFFERRRPVVGGLLLGYAIASKLYPGVLALYLLLRRDWQALRWTAATGAALALVTVVDIGWTQVSAFAAHLPKILSGEAFPGLRAADSIAINESVPGIVFKLRLFGVPGMDFAAAQVVGWIHTVVLVGMTAWLALRRTDRRFDPLTWIALLILATLRSPFLPRYGPFPALWLATLVIAAASASARPALAAVSAALGLLLAFAFGTGAVSPSVNAVLTFAHTLASLVFVFVVLPRVTETRALSAP
jgi:alpha-1,2-mannosyltransferase